MKTQHHFSDIPARDAQPESSHPETDKLTLRDIL